VPVVGHPWLKQFGEHIQTLLEIHQTTLGAILEWAFFYVLFNSSNKSKFNSGGN
jgi:hypothetical protein